MLCVNWFDRRWSSPKTCSKYWKGSFFFSSIIFKFLLYSSIVGFPANRAKIRGLGWCLLKVDHNCTWYSVMQYICNFSCNYFFIVLLYFVNTTYLWCDIEWCMYIWHLRFMSYPVWTYNGDRSVLTSIYHTYDIHRLYSASQTPFSTKSMLYDGQLLFKLVGKKIW